MFFVFLDGRAAALLAKIVFVAAVAVVVLLYATGFLR